jgi:hypothetical protein
MVAGATVGTVILLYTSRPGSVCVVHIQPESRRPLQTYSGQAEVMNIGSAQSGAGSTGRQSVEAWREGAVNGCPVQQSDRDRVSRVHHGCAPAHFAHFARAPALPRRTPHQTPRRGEARFAATPVRLQASFTVVACCSRLDTLNTRPRTPVVAAFVLRRRIAIARPRPSNYPLPTPDNTLCAQHPDAGQDEPRAHLPRPALLTCRPSLGQSPQAEWTPRHRPTTRRKTR